MTEYIARDAFIADKKWLYCTDCDKRKGKKRGKMVTLYEIGEAPCKSCGIHDMLDEVEMYPAADVRPVVRGKWIETEEPMGWTEVSCACCSNCGESFVLDEWGMEDMKNLFLFCPNCGARMDGDGE